MTEPFDLDAVLAEGNDVEPFRFTFDGETFEIPGDDLDLRVLAIAQQGMLDKAFELLVGEEQWEKMRSTSQRLGIKGMKQLFDAYVAHVTGTDSGKSSRSGGSSKSTAGRSKRTSSGTTKSD